eukprot:Skav210877  [mRNA]  locus=scaffold1173:305828:306925:- [translate_table: standard]
MWWCATCRCQNPANQEFCQECHGHWTSTWKPRRSRSKNEKGKKEKKERKNQEKEIVQTVNKAQGEEMSTPDWQVFPAQVPWVVGTPQSHLPSREVQAAPTPELPLPPAPVLPTPPVSAPAPAPFTSDEQKAITHLRGLIALGMTLPAEMDQQLIKLQQRERESASSKSLTHTHIHKLNRLRGQVSAAAQRVVKLDSEWKTFVATVSKQLAMHVQSYQQCRASHLETYQKKVQELAQAKQELSVASQLLIGQQPPEEMPMEAPNVTQDIQELQEKMLQGGMVEKVEMISDDGDEEDEMMPVSGPDGAPRLKPAKASTYREVRPAPFHKAHASPQKVTQRHLKQEHHRERRPRKEDVEEQEEETKET